MQKITLAVPASTLVWNRQNNHGFVRINLIAGKVLPLSQTTLMVDTFGAPVGLFLNVEQSIAEARALSEKQDGFLIAQGTIILGRTEYLEEYNSETKKATEFKTTFGPMSFQLKLRLMHYVSESKRSVLNLRYESFDEMTDACRQEYLYPALNTYRTLLWAMNPDSRVVVAECPSINDMHTMRDNLKKFDFSALLPGWTAFGDDQEYVYDEALPDTLDYPVRAIGTKVDTTPVPAGRPMVETR